MEASDRHASPVQILPENGHFSLHFRRSDSVSDFSLHSPHLMTDGSLAAATKCQKPLACFEVLVGGEAVEDEATSESVNLFSRSVELNFIEVEAELALDVVTDKGEGEVENAEPAPGAGSVTEDTSLN
jgi:hypothetical protein